MLDAWAGVMAGDGDPEVLAQAFGMDAGLPTLLPSGDIMSALAVLPRGVLFDGWMAIVGKSAGVPLFHPDVGRMADVVWGAWEAGLDVRLAVGATPERHV